MTETTDSVNDQGDVNGAATPWAGLDGSARPAACAGSLAAIAAWVAAPPGAPYSDAEDERILFLRVACRWTWRRIAGALGRPGEAVIRKRYATLASLYAFDRASTVRPFSPQEDAELVRLREDLEYSWQRIADQLGRPSRGCVRMRYGKIQQRRLLERKRKAAAQKATRRQCLDCPVWISTADAGHRRCDRCRARVASTPWDA